MKKICIITGTRAEYGLLKPLIKRLNKNVEWELQLLVTGMHLSPEFGLTYKEIEKDGYSITAKIEMLLSSDTSNGITKSMGVALIGFADFFSEHKPEIVVILGDRYEMLMAATAAMTARIPIAHIGGGELTQGAIDDAIRHSITKMSQLHFTATEEYRKRVIQLGELPQNVYNVGALGVENTKRVGLLDKDELEAELDFQFKGSTIMVTYHPVTLEGRTSEKQFGDLLHVIDMHKEVSVIFTKANSDADGRIINQMIDDFVAQNKARCKGYASLGQVKYLSTLKYCAAVVGNSSSGIIEAPSFGIPTVNIGDRQKGRICAESVISCGNSIAEMDAALNRALTREFREQTRKVKNPYEGENTSGRIVDAISVELTKGINLKKIFYDLNEKG